MLADVAVSIVTVIYPAICSSFPQAILDSTRDVLYRTEADTGSLE